MILADYSLEALADTCGFEKGLISSHSVDLRLGGEFKRWEIPYTVPSTMNHLTYMQRIEAIEATPPVITQLEPGKPFVFMPGHRYLAHTAEYIRLPSDVAGDVALKSSAARRGLEHLNAGFVEPTFEGHLTLEFVAFAVVTVKVGDPLVQLKCQRAEPAVKPYRDRGHYMGQTGATESWTEKK